MIVKLNFYYYIFKHFQYFSNISYTIEWSIFFDIRIFSGAPLKIVPINKKIISVKFQLDRTTETCADSSLNIWVPFHYTLNIDF